MAVPPSIRTIAGAIGTAAVVAGSVLLGQAFGSSAAVASTEAAPAGTLHARVASTPSSVATLFASATATTHFCTASVVDSPRGNVLITAGHCIRGSAVGWTVAPGFRDGISPYGRWRVTGVYMDPDWIADQNPERDYAFLTVAPRLIDGRRTEIQAVTGGNRLGRVPRAGEMVTVPAIPRGTDDESLTCSAKVYFYGMFPAFNCDPYVDGTSGSPWLVKASGGGSEIVGVIGGPNQGGCYPWTSYSSLIDEHALAAYRRAVAEVKPDVAPEPSSNGCTTGL